MNFDHILSPGSIGGLNLKNRIMLSPMGTMYAEEDGSCSERIWDYYESRARGGAGMIIFETASVGWPAGCSMSNMVALSDDRYIPGLRTLIDRMKRHGTVVAAQLNHAGKVATEDVKQGRPVMVPSVPKRASGDLFSALTREEMATFISSAGPDGKGPRYHPMTQEDIDQVVASFASAARRCREAGFDAIEIHGGHGYLISSFLSPYVNQRDDRYGGPIENRARLLTEVIAAVRNAVDEDCPVMVRIDANEYRIEGGITIEDAVRTAQLAEAAGADAIDVSAYANALSGIAFTEAPLVHQPGGLLAFAHAVKDEVDVPVVGVGRIDAELGEREIAAGRIDFVAMGRQLLADPDLPNKLAAGQPETVRPCIYCYVCVSQIFMSSPIVCASNPATGREAELENFEPAAQPRRIAVVGGGPAGMEAARVLALRGHAVTLYERDRKLGGTVRIAALPYAENGKLIDWLGDALERLPVDVRMRTEVSAASLAAEGWDHVVVATGALREAPEIPGKQLDHVFDGNRLRAVLMGGDAGAARGLSPVKRAMVAAGRLTGITQRIDTLRSMSRLWMPLGKHVVLIGGGLVGLELAEFLAERGRVVTVLEASPNLGAELAVVRRARVLHILREAGVTMIPGARVTEIEAQAVRYEVKGEAATAAADNVIISTGTQPDSSLSEKLGEAGIETSSIGDCAEIGYIEGALLSARELAVRL